MSASGYQQLPRHFIQLVLNTREIARPSAVACMLKAFERAIHAPTPRTTINRSVTRLRKCQPQAVGALIDWVSSFEVVEAMRKKGAWWAVPKCIDAFRLLGEGMTPHVAFGMNRPGKRKGMAFTATQDAGLFSRYLMQVGKNEDEAIELGQTFREQCLPRNSETVPEIRQLRAKVLENIGELEGNLLRALEFKYKMKLHTGD